MDNFGFSLLNDYCTISDFCPHKEIAVQKFPLFSFSYVFYEGIIADVLDIQTELTSVAGGIEQTKGQTQYLELTSATPLIVV